jgi:hypothetical protein
MGSRHFVWCCEHYDPGRVPGAPVIPAAPSANPRTIYERLRCECEAEDRHSTLIKGYKKTFKSLALSLYSKGQITIHQQDEILATMKAASWKIWQPILYLIPREPIEAARRLVVVPPALRASYAIEWQIADLHSDEFEILER